MFELFTGSKIGHIALSDIADQVVIVPATANIIGKIANGIADDFLTTMLMAITVPVLFVPSMNTKMWESTAVQGNIQKLKDNGFQFMEPGSGDLACGTSGKGRLPSIERSSRRWRISLREKDLTNEHNSRHCGPHHGIYRPGKMHYQQVVGKMGYAIAKIARRRRRGGNPDYRRRLMWTRREPIYPS